LEDYVCYSTSSSNPSSTDSFQTLSSGKPYPLTRYVTCDNFSNAHKSYLAAITKIVEPRCFHQAVADPNWREAIAKEIDALELNQTWTIEDLLPGEKLINCK